MGQRWLRDIIFIGAACIMVLLLVGGMYFEEKDEMSYVENRLLETFPKFSLDHFLDASYQDKIELALVDQLFLSETMKWRFNQMKNRLTGFMYTGAMRFVDDVEPTYTIRPLNNGVRVIKETGHLIVAHKLLEEEIPLFEKRVDNLTYFVDRHPDIDFYVYYIESSVDANLTEGVFTHELYNFLSKIMHERVSMHGFKLTDYDTFFHHFFKTDHHMNPYGQKKVYQDVIGLLLGEDEPILPFEIKVREDMVFYGFRARSADYYTIHDPFSYFLVDWGERTFLTQINGSEETYGRRNGYGNVEPSSQEIFGYYEHANGPDRGWVMYDYKQRDRSNLLVFVDSYSNPINDVIASHFNQTHFIDMRHYEREMGKAFDFDTFVQEHEVDQVLLMGSSAFFTLEDFLIPVE